MFLVYLFIIKLLARKDIFILVLTIIIIIDINNSSLRSINVQPIVTVND